MDENTELTILHFIILEINLGYNDGYQNISGKLRFYDT